MSEIFNVGAETMLCFTFVNFVSAEIQEFYLGACLVPPIISCSKIKKKWVVM